MLAVMHDARDIIECRVARAMATQPGFCCRRGDMDLDDAVLEKVVPRLDHDAIAAELARAVLGARGPCGSPVDLSQPGRKPPGCAFAVPIQHASCRMRRVTYRELSSLCGAILLLCHRCIGVGLALRIHGHSIVGAHADSPVQLRVCVLCLGLCVRLRRVVVVGDATGEQGLRRKLEVW